MGSSLSLSRAKHEVQREWMLDGIAVCEKGLLSSLIQENSFLFIV